MSTAVQALKCRPQVPVAEPVVAVSRSDLPNGALDLIPSHVKLRTWPQRRAPSSEELIELAHDAHGLLCFHTERINETFLRACPQLVVVSSFGVGHEHLDLEAIARAGVVVGYTPGVLDEATADLTWALILATARSIVQADRLVRTGGGDYPDLELFVGQDLAGATLGIVGYGRIGRAVARRAHGFGMRVIHHSRNRDAVDGSTWCDLDQLAADADVVTIHARSTSETRHMINAAFLRRMKPTAILVNSSRGDLIDQAALAQALAERWIFAAGLDVQEIEPIPTSDPLMELPNCILLPHIGSASRGARRATAELAVENLLAGLEGRPLPRPLVPSGEGRDGA